MRCPKTRVLWLSALLWVLSARPLAADEVAMGTFIHSDTDHTVVINPRLRAKLDIAEGTNLNLLYASDIWTSASVDIRTSASKRPVTEQRDEIDLGLNREISNTSLSTNYRYSTEHDFVSHSGSISAVANFASNCSTLGATLFGGYDQVGRAGDPFFHKHVVNYGVRPSFTQVIDKRTLAQLTYELSISNGYQSSPYRRVGVGGLTGRCNQDAVQCLAETNPQYRMRNAVALMARRAFKDTLSAGLLYRFYTDDWGLHSNTFGFDIAWVPKPTLTFGFRYRGYIQNGASHYQARYFVAQQYMTSDKELSPLTNHRISLELQRGWEMADFRKLTLMLQVAPIFYFYSNFVPLSQITAVQANVALMVEL